MSGRNPEVVNFGPYRFVPGDGLSRDGRAIALPPRAIGVLSILLETPGAVVPKQAIMDAVWPDTFVTDSSLLEAVGLIREALGDDRRNPTYIQTVHRRGYRFIGTLAPIAPGAPCAPQARSAPDAPPAPFFSGPEWRPIVAACVSYVLTTIGVAIIFAILGHPRPEPSMADLPLASPGFALSNSGDLVYVPTVGAPITPAWTPDGIAIAFAFSKAGPFSLLTARGDTALLARAGGRFPTSWSPGSAELAFTEYQPMTGADIWVVDVRTRTQRPLLRTRFDETWGRFSPDGRSIAYMSNETGQCEVYRRPSDGSGRAVRVSVDGGAWPSWSSDSSTVFFSAPGRAELRVVLEWFSELTKRPR
jgi:DNA-binding winged helix-turn-helix (wHTH) protein